MKRSTEKVRGFESEARRKFWLVHAEAWVRSGTNLTRYCAIHRLTRCTMKRWLRVLDQPQPKRVRREKKPVISKPQRRLAAGSRAYFAFWSMHLEAQRMSGLNASDYARRHRLSPVYFRRQKLRFERHPPDTSWRDLHPQMEPAVEASGANLRQQLRQGLWISEATETSSEAPAKRRRTFSAAQKVAIVTEADDLGAVAADVARRYQITPSMICHWRDSLGIKSREQPVFATACVIETKRRGRRKQSAPLVLPDLLRSPRGSILVELADGRQVFAPTGSDPEAVRAYVNGRENRP